MHNCNETSARSLQVVRERWK